MNPVERLLLQALSKDGEVDATSVAEKIAVPYATLMSLLPSLQEQGLVEVKKTVRVAVKPTEEGKKYAQEGTPEHRLASAVSKEMLLNQAIERAGLTDKERNVAIAWAVKEKLLLIRQGSVSPGEKQKDYLASALKEISAGKSVKDKSLLDLLRERKLIELTEEKTAWLSITPAGKKALSAKADATQEASLLTPEMLRDGSWRGKTFKPYDLRTVIAPTWIGKPNKYREFLNQIKHQLVGMGFREVSSSLVELEFWNMDALFMAQDHPAREIHDIFYLDDSSKGVLPTDYASKVKEAHEKGLDGSKGWRYAWSEEIAARLIARSHDTGISARSLVKELRSPDKVFFITRVFRPDEIDWKHFIEFNQLGGYVVGEDITFRELLGYLKTFAVEVFKAEDVKFAPSYFPFTEPSVELYAKIPGRGWAEVGGAGMFRPEMLRALGVDVPVIAWGLGIDRLAMISLGLTDIRDLFTKNLEVLRNQ